MALKPRHEADGKDLDTHEAGFGIGPRAFNIVWGNDTRYWRLPKAGEQGQAELVKVSWLEMHTEVSIKPGRKYKIHFIVSLKCDASGWKDCPVYLMTKIGKKGKFRWRKIAIVDEVTPDDQTEIPQENFVIETPTRQPGDEDDNILYFGLYEVWTGIAKGGLLIHFAEVYPVN